MGTVIDVLQLQEHSNLFRLIIYTNEKCIKKAKIESINKRLAEELKKVKPMQRTFYLEKCFNSILETLPKDVILKDLDVMFNPAYKVDIIRTLVESYKRHPFGVIWPGTFDGSRLIYSSPELPDYKVYEIQDYDILCVM